jgi:hypothetical protein
MQIRLLARLLFDIETSSRKVFLLDGLDEVPANDRHLARTIVDSIERLDRTAVRIVCSRPTGGERWRDYERMQLLPLSIDQQRNVMLKIAGSDNTKELLREIAGRNYLRLLTTNPMILSVVCLVLRSLNPVPTSFFRRNVDLYRVAIDVLLSGLHRSGY